MSDTPAPAAVLERLENGIAILRLEDPQTRNALSLPMRHALIAALDRAREDRGIKALVLTGAGSAFCSGGDISAMGQDVETSLERLAVLHDVVRRLAGFPRPVVAAVNGAAFGAGLSLALLADALIAAPEAKLAASFARVGLVPDSGFLWSCTRRIGATRTAQLFMSGEVLAAGRAAELGLVDALADDSPAAAVARAVELSALAPLPIAAAKAALLDAHGGLEQALAWEMESQRAMYASADHRAAVKAFRDKRAPSFSGC